MKYAKLHPTNFGIAWGLVTAICVFLTTLISMTGLLPQYSFWASGILNIIYGKFGYEVGFLGLILGPVYSFIDVFIVSLVFVLIYNKLTK